MRASLFQIGNCRNVTVMSLRSNKLEFLPDEIGQMTKLRVLNLSDNRWRGDAHTHAGRLARTRSEEMFSTHHVHVCLLQVEESPVHLHQAEGPGSSVAVRQSGIHTGH